MAQAIDQATAQLNKADAKAIIFDWSALIAPVGREIRRAAADGAKVALVQISVSDKGITDLANEQAITWADKRAAELVGMRFDADSGNYISNPDARWRIDEITRDGLNELVGQALDEGWSNDVLSTRIKDGYLFSDSRADMIARTETARADVQGNMIGYRESGLVTGKEWSTADDDLVSEECAANAEQGIIGFDENFVSGADAPPEHPNCRCDVLPVLGEEE